MPDQHAAATEHELISSITEPLGHLPEDPLAIVSPDFPIALRGYDRIAVDAYVERTTQLIAELESTRSPEGAIRRALQRVGEEISGVLQRAHETADEITARSRSEAEERLEAARREASQITAEAERRVGELDIETERIWAERHRIVTEVQSLAGRLTDLAEQALPAVATASTVDDPGVLGATHPFDGAVEGLDGLEGVEGLEGEEAEGDENWVEAEATDSWEERGAQEEWSEQPLHPPVGAGPPYEQPLHAPETPEPLYEQSLGPEPGVVDQPTAAMPPLEPWEGEEPGPFDARRH